MKRGRKTKPEVSPELAAIERLVDDGASSNATIRKRDSPYRCGAKIGPFGNDGDDERAMAKDVRSTPVREEISP
jgi:hypothetical protein